MSFLDEAVNDDLRRKTLRYRWVIFWIVAVAYLGAFFHRIAPAVVALDIQESFGISAGLMGLLASAYFYSYAAIQFPTGLLCDSLGPRKTMSLFLLIAGLGSLIFGFAPILELSLVGRILVGLGVGVVFTSTMKLLAEWFRLHEFSRMNGIFIAMGGVGALSAAAPLAWLTGLIGWRASFGIIGVVTLLLAVAVWLLVRNSPKEMGLASVSEIDNLGPVESPASKGLSLREGIWLVLTNKYFWPLAVWSFCSVGSTMAFGGLWAGPYLRHVYGMSRAEAGSVLNMLAVGIILGGPLAGYLSEKVFHSRKNLLIASSALFVAQMALLNLYPCDLPEWAMYLIILMLPVFSLAPAVISVTSVKELFPIGITGTSIGTVNLFPFAGAAGMQVGMGWALDWYGLSASGEGYPLVAYCLCLKILLIAAFVSLVSTFFMKETFPQQRR